MYFTDLKKGSGEMKSQLKTVVRHYRNLAQMTSRMLLPSQAAIELGVRSTMTYRDIHFPIPSIYLRKMFAVAPIDPASAVKLMPGTALDGGPNIIEQFILCSLIKMVRPATILELGTYRGGTTWHFYDNAPRGHGDLYIGSPGRRTRCHSLALQLRNRESSVVPAKVRARPPDSGDSKKWDGILDRKVQFAFIDADHSYERIRNDTKKTLPNLGYKRLYLMARLSRERFRLRNHADLLELADKGWKIFRIRGMHEISSLTIFMTEELREKLKIPSHRRAITSFGIM
jgi:hypothetical protein